jgi:hypothetical protein
MQSKNINTAFTSSVITLRSEAGSHPETEKSPQRFQALAL